MTENATPLVISRNAPTSGEAKTPHLLPANLGILSTLCAGSSYRYSMTGVKVKFHEGTYEAMATDGKYAAIVTGTCEDGTQYPSVAALHSAPNGATEAVVNAPHWKEAFRGIPKGRFAKSKPILANVAVVVGENVTTLATTDLDQDRVSQPRNLEGRFPDVQGVFPKDAPRATICVNPKLLITLLKAAVEFAEEGSERVSIELREATSPVVVTSEKGDQKFRGILMPLT